MAKLIIEKGFNKGGEYPFDSEGVLIAGRESGLSVQLSETLASRRHFRIEIRDGGFYLEDLNSTNGTHLNGRRVSSAQMQIGDRIRVGETLLSLLPDEEKGDAGGLIGKVLAGYRLSHRIGRGGMGTVYKAVQLSLNRPVALKILSDDLAKNEQFISMFIREARAAALLQHPNIVLAYDVGRAQNRHYFAMEYVSGGSVQEQLARRKRLTISEAIRYTIEAAAGLEYAEKKGIVHRDIKPDNLMITEDGGIKICDLGLAQSYVATDEQKQTEGIAGSPHYIAPEQALGRHIDHRADIYSLGATLYRMLAGATPFSGRSIKELLKKHVREAPRRLSELNKNVPQVLSHIVEKMLAKNPDERYQSAREVAEDLRAIENLDFGLELESDEDIEREITLVEDDESSILPDEAAFPATAEMQAEEVKPDRTAFPSLANIGRKTGLVFAAILVLGAIVAAAYFFIEKRLQDRWRRDYDEAVALIDEDLRASIDKFRKILEDYPDNDEVREEVENRFKRIKTDLLEKAESLGRNDYDTAVEMCESAKELFSDDENYVEQADEKIAEFGRSRKFRAALAELEVLLGQAQEFEKQNRADIRKIEQIYEAYNKVVLTREEKYSDLSPGYLEKPEGPVGRAKGKIDYYEQLLKEMKDAATYNTLKESIASLLKKGLYAEARPVFVDIQTKFPFLSRRDEIFAGGKSIERVAQNEFRLKLLYNVNRTIEKARYDSAGKRYSGFPEALGLLQDFRKRCGEGELNDEARKLIDEIESFQTERNSIEDLFGQDKRDEAMLRASAMSKACSNYSLRVLAERFLNEARHRIAGRDVKAALDKFEKLKIAVGILLNDFNFEEAKDMVEAYNSNDIVEQVQSEYESLKEDVTAQDCAHREIAAALEAAVKNGREIVIDDSNWPVKSVSLKGILLEGRGILDPWRELDSRALGALYTSVSRPVGEAERLGLAIICLKKGRDLRMFTLGVKLMGDLVEGSSRYSLRFTRYKSEMREKARTILRRLIDEYEKERDKAKKNRLEKEIHALNKFSTENLEKP